VVNIKRSFIDSNGADRHAKAVIKMNPVSFFDEIHPEVQALLEQGKLKEAMIKQVSLLPNALQKGVGSIFDSSVGNGTILAPFGGIYQTSPQLGMAAKVPTYEGKDAKTAILSTYASNPYLLEQNTYIGGVYAVLEAISKVVAMG
jgi:phosphoribosylformylglycinamidine synthase